MHGSALALGFDTMRPPAVAVSVLHPCQVEWLRTHIARIPTRLVFESALELMSCTQVRGAGGGEGGGGRGEGTSRELEKGAGNRGRRASSWGKQKGEG